MMDELLEHCMQELAFDGDLGCDVSRLRHFIHEFYTSQTSLRNQKVDDAFYNFVWSLLVQRPSIRVGLVPHGDTIEVYVAPRPGKRKKVIKPKKKQPIPEPAPLPGLDKPSPMAEDDDPDTAPTRLQPIEGAATYSLDQLVQQFGSGLRVAVDPETSFKALTGSHARPAKLTPMVYTTLQFISRGREDGLSVVNLGKKTGYDQKACFYLIKQLLELDLIVKLARGGSGGGNFCIHKYFFARSSFWRSVRREEVGSDEEEVEEKQDEPNNDDTSSDPRGKLQFDPIDARHLASPQLIKSRLIRLLKNSENGLHLYHNLIVTIGFSKPTKKDRRFFIHRIRELIKEGFIEKVTVPKMQGSDKVLCIRLVEKNRDLDTNGIVVQSGDTGDEEQEVEITEDKGSDMPVMNMTMHRQIVKLLEEANSEGLTLSNISSRLGMFDTRTVEQFLSRLERYPPPGQLADLAICDFFENEGRERRHRYYTLAGYLSFIQKEKIDHAERTAQYTSRDLSQVGGFYSLPDSLFYRDHAALNRYEDEYKDKTDPPKDGKARKVGRPRKESSKPFEVPGESGSSSNPRGKRKKDGAVHADRGGFPLTGEQSVQKGIKRKRKEDNVPDEAQPISKKKRTRSAKKPVQQEDEANRGQRSVAIFESKQQGRGAEDILSLEHLSSQVTTSNTRDVELPAVAEDTSAELGAQATTLTAAPTGHQDVHELFPLTSQSTPHFEPKDTDLITLLSGNRPNAALRDPSATIAPQSPPVALESRISAKGRTCPSTKINETSQRPITSNSDTSSGNISSKRTRDFMDEATLDPEGSVAKRSKLGRPKRTQQLNISQLRAENEITRVVEESGGIMIALSKEFYDTYANVVSKMAKAGEPTSMPVGTHPDRRTIRKILENLVDRGRLKVLTATVTSRHGVGQPRFVKLVYEPGVTQANIDQYLTTLRDDFPVPNNPIHKSLDQPVEYSRPKPRRTRDRDFTMEGIFEGGHENENWHRVFNISESTGEDIHAAFLSEHQTIAQLYGFLVGKARRARELHQFTLAHLQSTHLSSHVVSQTQRIIAFPYYFNDLPVSTYFAIVSATEHDMELSKLLETVEGRQTLVKDLTPSLHDKMKIGRARDRDKVLGLLEILESLKLVTALQPSTTGNSALTCEPNGTHPTQFDFVSLSRGRYTGGHSLMYWHFSTLAPIYIYSDKGWPPPFHRDMLVRTADESMSFWYELEKACLSREFFGTIASVDSMTGPCICAPDMARRLRRRQSWISSYVLSWNQKQYLQQWTNPTTDYTPLSDPDGGHGRLQHLCGVISAPLDVVRNFFANTRQSFASAAAEMRKTKRGRRNEQNKRRANEVRALLAKKAAEARHRLELDWDALVSRTHPGSLPHGSSSRLKALRTQYLQSKTGMTTEKWETAIRTAISGFNSGRKNPVLPASSRTTTFRRSTSTLPPIVANHHKSVAELIEQHMDKIHAVRKLPSKKKKKAKEENSGTLDGDSTTIREYSRRQRFFWTAEYDELARDVSAIIRARCRTWRRMEWAALDQIFPFLPRNSVRQRIVTLGQEAGGESYLRLLEEKWHDLWLEHRGTEALPDDHPNHPANFDAVAHVEFLRKYIDKRALKIGLAQDSTSAILSETLSDFVSRWSIQEKPRASNKFDFMWTPMSDEHREKVFLKEAFSTTRYFDHAFLTSDPRSNGVAESALKMTLTTSEEDYDVERGTTLLGNVGQNAVRQASAELLARGVVSEVGQGHRKRPGRQLKVSALNEDALGGSFHPDFFSEACAVEDMLKNEMDGWTEWSPIATDGEMATFVDLVSNRKVDFEFDVSYSAAQRRQLDWNSRKVDDDQITSVIAMRCRPSSPEQYIDPLPDSTDLVSTVMDVDRLDSLEHGQNHGVPAPCRLSSLPGVITCSACIDVEQEALLAELDQEDKKLCLDLIARLDEAGNNGLNYEALVNSSQERSIQRAVQCMTTRVPEPLCYWLGYTRAVLVSRRHIAAWLVSIPGPAPHLVFPRRWLNITGQRMENIWNAGLRAVVGVLVIRPGIPQTELRQRLLSVYDRQELNDLLSSLVEAGFIAKRVASEHQNLVSRDFRSAHGVEEQEIHWSLQQKAWYRVNE